MNVYDHMTCDMGKGSDGERGMASALPLLATLLAAAAAAKVRRLIAYRNKPLLPRWSWTHCSLAAE